MLAGDDYAFESLQAFFGFGFLNPNVHAYGIARLKIRDAGFELRLIDAV